MIFMLNGGEARRTAARWSAAALNRWCFQPVGLQTVAAVFLLELEHSAAHCLLPLNLFELAVLIVQGDNQDYHNRNTYYRVHSLSLLIGHLLLFYQIINARVLPFLIAGISLGCAFGEWCNLHAGC
jgi:hypothetical protein